MGKQITEMLKGTLEGIVLAILAVQPAYGYEITAGLRERGFTDIAEGTVYALLVSIEQKGLVDVETIPSEKGPPSKVYSRALVQHLQLGGVADGTRARITTRSGQMPMSHGDLAPYLGGVGGGGSVHRGAPWTPSQIRAEDHPQGPRQDDIPPVLRLRRPDDLRPSRRPVTPPARRVTAPAAPTGTFPHYHNEKSESACLPAAELRAMEWIGTAFLLTERVPGDLSFC